MGCANCHKKAEREETSHEHANNVRLDLAARRYLGTPFLHQGRDPSVGIDCVGLGQLACRDSGLTTPDWTDYGRNPSGDTLETRLREVLGEPVCCLSPGCLVSIDFKG